jgi:hypothetical protein
MKKNVITCVGAFLLALLALGIITYYHGHSVSLKKARFLVSGLSSTNEVDVVAALWAIRNSGQFGAGRDLVEQELVGLLQRATDAKVLRACILTSADYGSPVNVQRDPQQRLAVEAAIERYNQMQYGCRIKLEDMPGLGVFTRVTLIK